MVINHAENKIFEQWRSRCSKSIIPDGIVCESTYKAAKTKILFLLKEVNDEDGEEWDLRKFLYNGGRSKTWTPAAIWLKGIFALPSKLPFEEAQATVPSQRAELLRSIVCMNLKKNGGGARTKKKELQAVAEANDDLLNKQFKLYDDVEYVICCGPDVKNLAKKLIAPIRDAGPWRRLPETTVEYLEFAPHKYAIAFWHPQQYRYKHDIVYNRLINTIAILESRNR